MNQQTKISNYGAIVAFMKQSFTVAFVRDRQSYTVSFPLDAMHLVGDELVGYAIVRIEEKPKLVRLSIFPNKAALAMLGPENAEECRFEKLFGRGRIRQNVSSFYIERLIGPEKTCLCQ